MARFAMSSFSEASEDQINRVSAISFYLVGFNLPLPSDFQLTNRTEVGPPKPHFMILFIYCHHYHLAHLYD